MCINPADVTEVKCLFYNEVLSQIQSNTYGIECGDDPLSTARKLYNHIIFQCYSNDYIRNLVLDNDLELCERDTYVEGLLE